MENGEPLAVLSDVAIADPDGPNLVSAWAAIQGLPCSSTEEYLTVDTVSTSITVIRDGPCVELNGVDTFQNYSQVLSTLKYNVNVSEFQPPLNRTILLMVSDGYLNATYSVVIDLEPVDDNPPMVRPCN